MSSKKCRQKNLNEKIYGKKSRQKNIASREWFRKVVQKFILVDQILSLINFVGTLAHFAAAPIHSK
jgi:hypothetical protein